MQNEIGVESAERLNLKQGRGGLIDVEFVAQTLALAHGREFPELRLRKTEEILKAAKTLSLLTADEARDLIAGYEFLSRLANRLRIESDQAAWAVPTKPDLLMPLARRMGYRGNDAPARLVADLQNRRDAIRRAFDSCFAREQSRSV
jgi:glutamate-ammonia-ligase adenylyltransferase